jgi:hypothetical protein
LKRHGWIREDSDGPVPTKIRQEASYGWWGCYEDLQRVEAFHELAFHQGILKVLQRVLGGQLLVHGRRALSLIYPKCWIPPHQDFTYVQGAVDTITAWIPVTSQDGGNAALRIIPELSAGLRPSRPPRRAGRPWTSKKTTPAG